ncbi:MAG TPA: 50S ribosomal protein L10 [archaeon]|nr:50S ribosomal protein L10 [archaeon]
MVKEEKVARAEELKSIIEKYPVIGLVDMFKLPSRQLQEIKKNIRGKGTIKMTKKALLMIAIGHSSKPNIKELVDLIPQQPALILAQADPFKFYSMVGKLKSRTFAKEGDVTMVDIHVSAGPTSLLPGPAISELSKAGIPAGVEEGKIAIKKDVTVAKKGDIVSKPLAAALRKLGIETMEVGLKIVAIYDNGTLYKMDVLSLVNVYPEKLKEAYNSAMNLSVSISYPTKENIKFLLAKAFNSANGLKSKVGGVS